MSIGSVRSAGCAKPAQGDQKAEQEHREAQVRGDQRAVEAVLHGQPAERRLSQHEDSRGDRAPDQQAVVAKPPERLYRQRHDQHHDDGRGEPMAELDHLVLLEEGQHAALRRAASRGSRFRPRRIRVPSR